MHFFFAKNPIQISRRAKRGGQLALAKSCLAVYFRNSSNGILPSPRGARLGGGEAKRAGPPRTLKTAKEPENKSARTIFCNGKRNFFHLIKNWLENSLK